MASSTRLDKRGFTLVELLVVIAMLAVLFLVTSPAYESVLVKYQLVTNASDLRELLRTAQGLAMASREDSAYGVHFLPGKGGGYVLFKGESYATRDLAYEELSTTLPRTLTLVSSVAGDEIVFSTLVGSTEDAGEVTINSTIGDSRAISVNAAGMVDVN